jgi:hypothetical protein
VTPEKRVNNVMNKLVPNIRQAFALPQPPLQQIVSRSSTVPTTMVLAEVHSNGTGVS